MMKLINSFTRYFECFNLKLLVYYWISKSVTFVVTLSRWNCFLFAGVRIWICSATCHMVSFCHFSTRNCTVLKRCLAPCSSAAALDVFIARPGLCLGGSRKSTAWKTFIGSFLGAFCLKDSVLLQVPFSPSCILLLTDCAFC